MAMRLSRLFIQHHAPRGSTHMHIVGPLRREVVENEDGATERGLELYRGCFYISWSLYRCIGFIVCRACSTRSCGIGSVVGASWITPSCCRAGLRCRGKACYGRAISTTTTSFSCMPRGTYLFWKCDDNILVYSPGKYKKRQGRVGGLDR